jgi:thiol-disulfide isomerase/thioredoxin
LQHGSLQALFQHTPTTGYTASSRKHNIQRTDSGMPPAPDNGFDFATLVGPELLTRQGPTPTAVALGGKAVVGLYFSAHWCPPCRGFTPELG